MPVAAGELRHRVTLYAPNGTYGAGSPANIAEGVPVNITALPLAFQQQERINAGGLRAQTVYAVVMRYREDVTEDLELVEECCMERTFRILSIIPDDRLINLELTCVVGPRVAA